MFLVCFIVLYIQTVLGTQETTEHGLIGRSFVYNNTYKYDKIYTVIVNQTTQQVLDFQEENDKWTKFPTRVHVSCNDSDPEHPLFITATQQKGVSSWELPLVAQGSHSEMVLSSMARTLCPHDANPHTSSDNRPTVQMSTSNPHNLTVAIKLRRVQDFYVEVDREVTLNVTPSTPKYYYFSFESDPWNATMGRLGLPRFNYTIPKSVILMIESDDEVCAVVSIQNNTCPVFDTEREASYRGYHLTMTGKGGITLTQSMFPQGFYIVLIVKEDDSDCLQAGGLMTVHGSRVKNFRFQVIATISYWEYLEAALLSLALILTFYVLVVLLSYITCRCQEELVITEEEVIVTAGPSNEEVGAAGEPGPVASLLPPYKRQESLSSSDGEAEGSAAEAEAEAAPLVRALTLQQLARRGAGRLGARSDQYLWGVATVATVYALPVVQLLVTYQHMVFQTGNQDLCYYNFMCAHPLGQLSDFNHVYSNVGYVLLGVLFMGQVWRRQVRSRSKDQSMGIPQHHGMLHGMGVALAMEGLLSACYHLCPNSMNFQFDSSFMYLIAVLCMVKLYQSRHPDVNARAHSTFGVIAAIFAIGLFGILNASIYFWAAFTVVHLTACLYLTLKIYYVGRFKPERAWCGRAWRRVRAAPRAALAPRYRARFTLLAIANVANWTLAIYGLYGHKKDFARHLLAILMGNTILYTLFYIVMKLAHRERVRAHSWLFMVGAHAAWFAALYLFLDSKTKWAEPPARSRERNAPCTVARFYDSHDLWHYLSAAALFLSFNLLLTIDDPLQDTPRHLIPVF